MPRQPRLCPLCSRRVVLLGLQIHRHRLVHSNSRPRSVSGLEMTVGLVVLFTSFLAPCAWMLRNMNQYRRP